MQVAISQESFAILDEGMPLNDQDKAWIGQEIRSSHRRHGWSKLTGFIKDWIGVAAVIAIVLGAVSKWTDYVDFKAHTEDRLKGLEDGIKEIKTALNEIRLQYAAANPQRPASTKEASEVLISARGADLRLNPDILSDAGTRFIGVVAQNPKAWATVKQFLDYRSFINADFAPSPSDLTPARETGGYHFALNLKPKPTGGKWVLLSQVFTAGGYTSPENSARLETIDTANAQGSGFGLIVVEGKAWSVLLDGMRMKNVIVRNATVEYSGGALDLENVYFVNCKLEIHLSPAGKRLGEELLASAAVTFKLPRT